MAALEQANVETLRKELSKTKWDLFRCQGQLRAREYELHQLQEKHSQIEDCLSRVQLENSEYKARLALLEQPSKPSVLTATQPSVQPSAQPSPQPSTHVQPSTQPSVQPSMQWGQNRLVHQGSALIPGQSRKGWFAMCKAWLKPSRGVYFLGTDEKIEFTMQEQERNLDLMQPSSSSPLLPSLQSSKSPVLPSVQLSKSPVLPSVQLSKSPVLPSVQLSTSPVLQSVQLSTSPVLPSVQLSTSPVLQSVQLSTSPVLPSVHQLSSQPGSPTVRLVEPLVESEGSSANQAAHRDLYEKTKLDIRREIGSNWPELARALNFNQTDIDAIQVQHPNDLHSQIFAMIHQWEQRHDNGRGEVIEFLQGLRMAVNNSGGEAFREFRDKIFNNILEVYILNSVNVCGQWHEIAQYLKFSQDEIRECALNDASNMRTQAEEFLKQWVERDGWAVIEALPATLEKAGFEKTAAKLQDEVFGTSPFQQTWTSVPQSEQDNPALEVGHAIEVQYAGLALYGTLKWQGSLPGQDNIMAGVELEVVYDILKDTAALCCGEWKDNKYFSCMKEHGAFFPLHDVSRDKRFSQENDQSEQDKYPVYPARVPKPHDELPKLKLTRSRSNPSSGNPKAHTLQHFLSQETPSSQPDSPSFAKPKQNPSLYEDRSTRKPLSPPELGSLFHQRIREAQNDHTTPMISVRFQNPTTLKVNNLPKSIQSELLKSWAMACDPQVTVKVNLVPKQPTNFAYINCSSPENASKIHHRLGGHSLPVRKGQSKSTTSVNPGIQSRLFSLKLSRLDNRKIVTTDQSFAMFKSLLEGCIGANYRPPDHGFLIFQFQDTADSAYVALYEKGYEVTKKYDIVL